VTAVVRTVVELPSGYRSAVVARALWALDEQSRKLVADTRGLTPEDLGWQPAPGTNTIGMLLAHIAVAEVHLTAVGLERRADSDVRAVLGIGMEEEGLPLAPGAPPSPALAGWDIAAFHDLLARARENTRGVARSLTDEDLAREVRRPRSDGGTRVLDGAWVLYHMLEHEAGHHGQVNQLRHLRAAFATR
jgi:uncharacterized damage-inducible protein DinB